MSSMLIARAGGTLELDGGCDVGTTFVVRLRSAATAQAMPGMPAISRERGPLA
jgi:hypothetical protein